MIRSTLAGSVAAFFYLGFAATLLAAQPAATGTANQSSRGKSPPLSQQRSALTICAPSTIRWRRTAIGWADLTMATAIRWAGFGVGTPR